MSPDRESASAGHQASGEQGEEHRSRAETDRLIGAAVGVTMTRYAMTYADASAFLRDLAGHHQRGLLDLARTITTSRWPSAKPYDRTRDGSPVDRLDHAR